MTIAYSNGVAIFGSTDLDSLASDSSLLAGRQSAVITNSVDNQLISGRFKANNTAPTIGKLEVWCVPVWDIAGTDTYPDAFSTASAARSITYRNVIFQSGKLIQSFDTDATSNRIYEFANISLEERCGICPKKFVIWVVHSMAQALNTTASAGGQCWNQPITY